MNDAPVTSEVRERFLGSLDHPVDPFQVAAMDSLDAGSSVLVAAPTGSGKTLVAEYAIECALAAGGRAFYTAPLKALSNQKYRDLATKHGYEKVGLVTGDNAINPDARVVVMTTEVLRNMIYTGSSRIDDLAVVVLDEVHFLQDAYRGPVWEEVIIQLPPEVQLVCLSATVSNAAEVAEWLSTVRGRTDPVVEHTRPVELLTHFAYRDSATDRVEMHDTIVGGEPNRHLQRLMASAGQRSGRRGGGGAPRRRFFPPSRTEVVDMLESRSMLPAIVFIFSRAQCEDAVRSCARDGLVLTSAEEEDEIIAIVGEKCSVLSDDDREALGYDEFLETVGSGIACHHAGMIPMFKEAVEECFVRGLVKVVFATETLAVGINMPARAVVIEKLTKYTGEHHALLRASEYTQLTGRAGRRGLDEIGHAVTLWSPWVTFDQAAGLALSRSFRLSSAFRPTFNMAANMITHHTREATMHVLNLSFAQFQADRDIVTTEAQLERKKRELALLEREHSSPNDAHGVEQIVIDDDAVAGAVETEISLRALRPGDVVVFDASNVRGRGLVLATAARRAGVRLTVLLPSRKIVEVTGRDLRSLPTKAASVLLPVPFEPARTEFLREATARLVRARVDDAAVSRPVERDRTRTDAAMSGAKAVKRLRREVETLSARAQNRSGSVYGRFLDVTDVLAELGYVDGWMLLPKGRALATIFHESDLLVVEVMSSGALAKLSAVDLVGVVSSLVFEPRGQDAGAYRWPNDTVRNRIKRIEKISDRLQDVERRHGLHTHRPPHPGLSWEASAWASGRPLSRILDPELTPGDFVRTMRQLIDLLRQIAASADDVDLRATALEAVRAVDRGVVAAAAAGSSQ